MDKDKVQDDALRKEIEIKLQDPVFKQKVISEYKSRLWKFTLGSILIFVLMAVSIFLAPKLFPKLHSDMPGIFFMIICFAAAASSIYLGYAVYRCPACGCKLQFMSGFGEGIMINGRRRLNLLWLPSCPECGAPFR
jgi:hypothetical protein